MPTPMREIGRNVTEYAQADDANRGREREEANELLKGWNVMADRDARARLESQLEATGVLPTIVLLEKERLDGDRDDNNIDITKDELSAVANNPENYDATTVMAADNALKNFDAIDTNNDDKLDAAELQAYARKSSEGRVADPDEMFGKWTPESPRPNDPSRRDDNPTPGENPEGGTSVRVEQNDSLWKIAKRACPDGANEEDVRRKWVEIMRLNGMNPNSKIYPGDEIRMP